MKAKLLLVVLAVFMLVYCGQGRKDLQSKLEDAKGKAKETLKEAEKEMKDVEKELKELKEVVEKEVKGGTERKIEISKETAHKIAVKIFYLVSKYGEDADELEGEIKKIFEKYDFTQEEFNRWGENWEEEDPEEVKKFKEKAKKEAEELREKEKK